MADPFDRLLAEVLAPPEREPDRQFVRVVQTRIALEEQLARERWRLLSRLGFQVVALAAVAAGVLLLARSPELAGFAAESPGLALAILLAGFSFVIAVLASSPAARQVSRARI